ncbi:carboxymuconolactone decarboxylase family protein [Pelagibacterium lacus]|nr:carboxymuconolactone decarboxylase family protein [Pelagibacterium lacus]
MARLPDLDPRTMTDEQQAVCEEVLAGPRSRLPAPLRAWLFRPELARRGQSLGAYARYGTCLAPHLSELAILVTARFWGSEYEWHAHKTEALKAGVPPAAIDAIEADAVPDLEDQQSRCVHDLVRELYASRTLSEESYRRGEAILGRDGMIDLVAIAGYYSFVAMTLNVFDIGVPEGAERPFGRGKARAEAL